MRRVATLPTEYPHSGSPGDEPGPVDDDLVGLQPVLELVVHLKVWYTAAELSPDPVRPLGVDTPVKQGPAWCRILGSRTNIGRNS